MIAVPHTALPIVVASGPIWDRLHREDVAQIIAIQNELRIQGRGGRVLRRTARLLGITVPTLDRVMLTWNRSRASTISRVREALALHAGQCLKHTDCAEDPELGRACFAARSTT